MKDKFKYILNLLKVLIWPIIFVIGEILITGIFTLIFNIKTKGDTSYENFLEYMKTDGYREKLVDFINSQCVPIIILTMAIFIPIFYLVFKKYRQNTRFKLSDSIEPLVYGMSISLIFNIIVYSLNNVFNFTSQYNDSPITLISQIICTGICGPILEEFLFRGIVYNKLKSFNKQLVSIILCSIIFGMFHDNIINAIYGFGVSFILIYLYEKYKNLKAPIIMHISLNLTTILMLPLIKMNFIAFNLYLFVISIITVLILKQLIKYE